MNIIAIICAKDPRDRELCGGFLASKGFLVTAATAKPSSEMPVAIISGSIDGIKDVVKSYAAIIKKKKDDVRIIAVQVEAKASRKPSAVSEIYHVKPDKNKVKLFLALEDVIRKEKGISRGTKPRQPISVPV